MIKPNPVELIDRIKTKDQLVEFIEQLRKDYAHNREEWQNLTLDDFLESMAAWIRSTELTLHGDRPRQQASASWKSFAEILYAGKIYE